MITKEIIELLKEKETDFLKTKSFSQFPGIYAFFFIGNDFPLIGNSVTKNQIIYIGKTESSQEKRDAKTHFTTGKTGSSTVRKSIGSMLCATENLKPIPRNETDYKKKRFSHFKFDNQSEIKITNWMEKNLALSFYEYPRTKQEIEDLETKLIDEVVPILNISQNPKNSFKDILKSLRKNCALMAAKDFNPVEISNQQISNTPQIPKNNMASSGKYTDLWSKQRTSIQDKLKNAKTKQSIQLNSEDFNEVGNRSNYSFNLEFLNGIVSNNIGGSAVARDLAQVLANSKEIKEILKTGHFKINMDRQFCLWIGRK